MAQKVTFEDSMKRLEEIVRRLEEKKVPLEESIRLYDEGMKIGKRCRKLLDDADRRIRDLSGKLEEEATGE